MRNAVAATLVSLLASTVCLAEGPGAPEGIVAPGPDARPYGYLLVERWTPRHCVTITVNGELFALLRDGGSADIARPLTFREGENAVEVRFVPLRGAAADAAEDSGVILQR